LANFNRTVYGPIFDTEIKRSVKMENEKIIHAVSAVFSGADERDWKKVRNAMAENVLLDYYSLSGSPAAVLSSMQIIETWKGFLPGFDRTHHQLSNFRVTRHSDTAKVHCDGKADHFIDKDVWTVEGSYDAEAIKINSRWVMTMLKFNLSKQSGNTNLPAQAIERLKTK
jgi:hypothetical protein